MADIQPRRSLLYVPADRPRAIAKARTLPVDGVIFDLEDAIAPEAKGEAREALRSALAESFNCPIAVRINGLATEWATEDILAAVSVRADAVLVPKVDGPGVLCEVAEALGQADALADTEIWAMVEGPKALVHIAAIAALAERREVPLSAFLIGINDLAVSTRVPLGADRTAFIPWFMRIVAAARAHGIDVLDGPCNTFRDAPRFEAECREARALGMDGKQLIHPSQVETANRVFAPTAEERGEAEEIVSAFGRPENQGKGVIGLNGSMVERLHLAHAERVLVLAAAIEERAAH
jgi:citrate lyase subunit beta/citryl-CoA lyase